MTTEAELKSESQRIEQIRRANESWKPNPSVNPSAFHAKNDIEFLLGVIQRMREEAREDLQPVQTRITATPNIEQELKHQDR
jgi:hypothetical protein